jgi:hypothetical protein
MDINTHLEARRQKQAQDLALRDFHAKVCELLESERRQELLRKAQERIRLWETRKLCSSYFIRHWTAVLSSQSTDKFKSLILDPNSKHALGLMQNTPFSFLISETKNGA